MYFPLELNRSCQFCSGPLITITSHRFWIRFGLSLEEESSAKPLCPLEAVIRHENLHQSLWPLTCAAASVFFPHQKRRTAIYLCLCLNVTVLCLAESARLCFRGVGPGCNTREIADKLIDLKAELDDLALREHELDQQRVWVQQSIKNVTDDSNNSPYP